MHFPYFFSGGNFKFQSAEHDWYDSQEYNLFYTVSHDIRHYLDDPCQEQLEITFLTCRLFNKTCCDMINWQKMDFCSYFVYKKLTL